jgi:hypothetical protein
MKVPFELKTENALLLPFFQNSQMLHMANGLCIESSAADSPAQAFTERTKKKRPGVFVARHSESGALSFQKSAGVFTLDVVATNDAACRAFRCCIAKKGENAVEPRAIEAQLHLNCFP